MKRYIVEWGVGVDIHGGDVTKAAKYAVKDAVSHTCLCGITELVGMTDQSKGHSKVKISCPHPELLDVNAVLGEVPVGNIELEEVTSGGMSVRGMHKPEMGEGNQIVIAIVALTVYLDV
jgi:uncharacterized protein (TIGR02058 family)